MEKTPTERLPFSIDWTAEIGTTTVASSTWTIDPRSGITKISDAIDVNGKITTVLTDKGRIGGPYEARNTITRSDGVTQERSLFIQVVRYKTK